jgi:2-polyprenyl-3-methyl-5-hydroxy-6-metoxy-1,4-benzoquinol methylase
LAATERIYKSDLDSVREDHLARYLWAAERIGDKGHVIDAACGCGYGSSVLADRGCDVTAIDVSGKALSYARQHWDRPSIDWLRMDLLEDPQLPQADVVVSFETVEHLKRPKLFLRAARLAAPRLIMSVPNEAVFPWSKAKNPFHCRHYTKEQLEKRLRECGWRVQAWFGQKDKFSLVWPDLEECRTIIADAVRI